MLKQEATHILREISAQVGDSTPKWMPDTFIQSSLPKVVTRPWSFMLRYPLSSGSALLVKVARHEEMSIEQAVSEKALLERTEREFEMLSKIAQVFQSENGEGEFCFVQPLGIFPHWNALAMEELDAQMLKEYLLKWQIGLGFRKDWDNFTSLLEKALRWLRAYHLGMGNLQRMPLSETKVDEHIETLLQNLRSYLPKAYLGDFGARLMLRYKELGKHNITFSMLHGDFHCGNILVAADGRVGALDADLRRGHIYEDIAKVLADIKTRGIEMLTQGLFFSEKELARTYQAVIKGYFADEECDEALLHFFILVAILEKWLNDEKNLKENAKKYPFLQKMLTGWRRRYFSRLVLRALA
ncbi:MAG: aminoglycoside phosphotransferase family protein [Chloroflexi bacterium]|nr:aminoglycoside phosphotransferase family protein [Chloroflexota bacterium]